MSLDVTSRSTDPGRLLGLVEVGRRVGLPLQAPGEACVFQPHISEHEATDARSLVKQATRATYAFSVELIREGILMSSGNKMYVSTVHDDTDVDRTLEAAERALRRVKGYRDGCRRLGV